MLPPGGMDGTGSCRTGRGCRCQVGALDSSVPGRDSALDKCSVLPGPVSVSRVEDTVTEIPGTSGQCASEGCSRSCCHCRGGAGTSGPAGGPLLVRERRRARKVLPRSGPRRVVLRRDLSPRCRAVWGAVRRGALGAGSLLEYGRIQAWPGKWNPCGRRRGRTGPRGVGAGSVRAAAGAERAARGRQGAITGRAGSGGGVSLPAPPPPPRPAPGARRCRCPAGPLPPPPPAQGGPGPRHRAWTCSTGQPPWEWCSPGAARGAAAPVPGALPVGQPPWPQRHRGISIAEPLCVPSGRARRQ